MTDAEYDAWLADLSARRVVLCELDYAGGTEYVASQPYISHPTDTPPHRPYDDLLAEAIDIETRTDSLIRFGEISLVDDGSLWRWVQRAWQGHGIRIYLGDPDWPLADFRLLARGINDGLTGVRQGELTFGMVDQSAQLDTPIDTGSLPEDAGPVPLALGRLYNVPAARVSTSALTYRVSFLPLTAVTPKDLGNPVPHTKDLAGGAFTLDNATQTSVTADLEEAHETPVAIVQWVADQYGLTVSEASLPAYTVGLFYDDQVTGRKILDELCGGLGAYWYLNALGELVVRQHVIPSAPDVIITPDDIEYGQLALTTNEQPWRELTLRWGRNYAPLRSVAGTLEENDPNEASRLRRQWSTSLATQTTDDHPLAESATRDSCIQLEADALVEVERLIALRTVRADVWEIDAFLPPVSVGQAIEVEHTQVIGMVGRVIGVSRSPTRSTTTVQVWYPAPWPPGELSDAVTAFDIALQDTLITLFEA